MPTLSSSLTECWVGLVFSSPATGYRAASQVDEQRVLVSHLVAELADRLQGRVLSMSPTVPPISHRTKSSSVTSARMNSLIASVTCGMTWTVAPR